MQRVFRPLAVFSIATGACLALGLQLLVNGARGSDGRSVNGGFFTGYDLAKLELVEPTLYHIDESYVDPGRIDWEGMYVAALAAIERRVPTVLFTRESGAKIVAVEIGDFRTVLEVAPVTSRPELQQGLSLVAELLRDHLRAEDIPTSRTSTADPFAEVEYAAINGMLSTLDPHSVLLPPDAAREMDAENQGEFGGLGITIEMDESDGRLRIVEPYPETPASRAGLRSGDHILRIDGESTVNLGLDEAVTRLRGPVGAPVELEIARDGTPAPFPVRLLRQLIPYNETKGRLLDGSIGYISIESFNERTDADLHRWLGELTRDAGGRLAGLVLDLRGNPGGYLNQAVKVADAFLESGEIVSTIDRNGRQADREEANRAAEPLYPIAVLVDANSASASEIVAGALRYNERAVIIGERSFGKGSVQNLHPFYDDSKLKLTISKYLTAGDRSLQAVGIPADIEMEDAYVPADLADDGVYLFTGDSLRREADLDRALERVTLQIDPPAYRVRYLAREEPGEDDPVLSFARDVVDAASGWRRSDVLSSAAAVVARHQRLGNDAVAAALGARGIDWRAGPPLPRGAPLPVSVRIEVVDGSVATAGQTEQIAVTVENTGSTPLYRVAAVASDLRAPSHLRSGLLDRQEYLFGYLAPGEKRTATQEITVPSGWPSEHASIRLAIHDAGREPIGVVPAEIEFAAVPVPALTWRWRATDAAHGDGDGILDPGEAIDLELTVTNIGERPSTDAFARVRNHARTRLDLVKGTLLPGEPAPGCEGLSCPRALAPGASWTGSFALAVHGATGDLEPIEIGLDVGDGGAFDNAAFWRETPVGGYEQNETVTLTFGSELPSGDERRPPVIDVTRAAALVVDAPRAALSGAVRDDHGLAHVMVFVGDDKVFLETGGDATPIRSLPFTVDAELAAGANVVTVVATDDQGLRTTRSAVIWRRGEELAKASP